MKNKIKKILNIMTGCIFLYITIFLFISIFTYNKLDSSLTSINNSNIIFNKMGYKGAFIADLFLQMFGYFTSYLIILIITINSRNFFINKNNKNKYNVYLKIVMFIVLILCSCSCITKINNNLDIIYSGGTIGYYLNSMTGYINNRILIFFNMICMILSLNILTDFDYEKFFKIIGIFFATVFLIIKYIHKFIVRFLLMLIQILLSKKIYLKLKDVLNSFKNNFFKKQNKNNTVDREKEKREELFEKYIKQNKHSERIENLKKEYNLDLVKFVEDKEKKNNTDGYGEDFSNYKIPALNLLKSSNSKINLQTKEELREQGISLTRVLSEYKINGKITSIKAGPIITLHEFEPAAGIKSSRIINSADDIARNLKVKSTRISVISEKNALGIELPNKIRNVILLKDVLESNEYKNSECALPIVLGVNIAGEPVIIDLAKCPHLLIAGTTGSGKSVAINTMILSLLYKFTPDECKFIMIDPKILELSVYQNIPHLLTPVVTDSKKAVLSLKWVVNEMENRYRLMSNVGVRNIYGYNEKIKEAIRNNKKLTSNIVVGYDKNGDAIYDENEIELKIMPFIVVVVDEMADLMLTAGKDVEALIQRIAQMARAAGIHIIMSTQRPSTDVITGVIKANFPSRISFLVSSKIDSRVIIGEQGAEQLLGYGDMLYSANGGKITRAHGPFISDEEIESIMNYILKQNIKPKYIKFIQEDTNNAYDTNVDISILGEKVSGDEDLYKQAIEIIKRDKKVSISYIQRQLRIGYNKAANIIEKMEKEGIVSQANHIGKRELIDDKTE